MAAEKVKILHPHLPFYCEHNVLFKNYWIKCQQTHLILYVHLHLMPFDMECSNK